MNLNKVMIIGNLTRDPEMRTTNSGQNVVTFSVATNRIWTNASGQRQESVEYHNIVAWGKLAEICRQFLTKGRKVYIEGRLQTRDWVGQDGAKRNRTEIITENMIMLDRAPSQGANFTANQNPSPAPSQIPEEPSVFGGNSDEEINVETIPF
ncbi:MAG: single-stranded DNA-binding protein [bacterium]